MPGGMQVDVLVDRLRKVEAQIAQKERVAGTDLATLKVPVLSSCMPHHTALQAVLNILELVLHTPCMQMLDLIFYFDTLAAVNTQVLSGVSCPNQLRVTACLSCVVWFDVGADALASPASSSTSKPLSRLLCPTSAMTNSLSHSMHQSMHDNMSSSGLHMRLVIQP